jgi:hypothetical protein
MMIDERGRIAPGRIRLLRNSCEDRGNDQEGDCRYSPNNAIHGRVKAVGRRRALVLCLMHHLRPLVPTAI